MDSSGTSIQSNKGSTKKVIYVWENGDFNGNGQVLSINSKIYRSWKDVLGYITKIVKPSFGAAVTLFDIESKRIVTAFKELEPYGKYAVLGMEKFKERRNGYKTQKEREVLSQIPARPLSYTVAHFTQPSTSTTISPNRKIMLFVLPNGRSQEMPCKVVLTDSDMKLWNLILGLIAKALNMPLGVQFLHTVYGVPVRDPKFFLNGNIYIAVPVNERFVPLDYPLIFRNILPETEEDLNKIEIISENPESRSVVGKSKSDGLSTLTNPGIYYFQEQTGRRYPVVNRAEVNTYKPSGDVFYSAHPNQLQKPQTPEELFEIMKKSYGVDKTKPIWTDKVEESRPLENKPFSDRETPYIERIQTRRESDFYKKPNVSANYEPDLTPEPVLVKDNLVLPKTPTKQPKTVASYDSHAHMVSKAAENTSEPPVEDRPNNHRENYRTSTPQRAADKKVEKHRNKHKKKEIPHRNSSEDVMVIHQNMEFPNKSHEELEETSYQKKPVGDTRKAHKSRSRISRSKSRPKADKSKSRSRIGKSDRSRSRLGKSKSKTNRSQSRVEKSKTGRSRSRSGRSGSRLGKSRSKVGRSKSRGSTDTIKSGRVRREKKKEPFDENIPTGCSPATCPFGGPKPKVACGMGKPGPGVVKCFSELGCHLKPGEKRKVCMTETCRLNPCKKGTKCEVDPKTGDKCAVPCDSILDCKKGKETLTTESADSTTLKEQPTDSNLGLMLEDSETPASGVPEEEMLTVTPSEVSEEPIMAKTAMLPSEGARSKKDPLVLRPGDPGYDEFNDKYGPRETRGLRPGDRGYGDPLLLRPGEPGYEEYINTYGDPDSQKEKPGDLGKGNPIVVRPGDPGYEEFNDKYGAPESRGLRPGDAGYGAPLLLRPGEPGYNEYLNKYGVPQPQGIKPKDSGYGAPIVIRPRDPGYDEFNHKYGDPESRNKKPGDPGYGTPLILRPGEPGYDDYISNYGIPGGLRPGDPGYGPPIILRPEDAGYDEFNDKYGAPGSRGLRPGDPGYGTPLALRPGDRGYDEYVNKYGKPAFRSGAPEPKGAPITLRPGDPGYDEFNDKYGPPGTRGLRPGDRGYGTPLTLRPGTPAYDEYLRKYGRPGARKKRPSDIPGYGTPILLRPGVPGYDEFTNKYGPPKSRGLRPKDAGYGAPWVLKPGDPGYEEYLKKYGVPKQGLRPGDPGYGIPLVVRPGDPAYEEFFDKYGPPESRGRRPGDAGYGIPLVLRQGDPGYDDYIGTYGIPGGLKPGDVGYGTPIMLRPDDPGYDEFNGKYGAPGSRELRPGDPYYGTPLVLRPGDTGYDEYINKFGAPGARRQKSAAPPRDDKAPLVLRPVDPGYDEYVDKYGPPEMQGLGPGDPDYGKPLVLRSGDPGYDEYNKEYGLPAGKKKAGDPGSGDPLVLRPGDPGYDEFVNKYGPPRAKKLRPGDPGYGAPLVLKPGDPGYNDYVNKYGVPGSKGLRPGDPGYGLPLVVRPGDPGYDEFNGQYGTPESRDKIPGDPGYGTPLILRPGDPGYDDYLNAHGIPGGLRPGDPGYAPPLILRPEDPGYEDFNDKYGAPGSKGLRPGDTGYGTPLVLRPPDPAYDDYKRKYGSPKARASRPGDPGIPLVIRPGDPAYDQFMNKYGPPSRRGLRPGDPGYGAPVILRPGDPGYDDYLNTHGIPGGLRPGDPGYAPPLILRPDDPGYEEFNDKYGAPGSRGLRPGQMGYGTPLVLRPPDPAYDDYKGKYGSPKARASRPGDAGTPLVIRPGDPAYDQFMNKYGPPGRRGLRPGDPGYGAPVILRPEDPGYDDYLNTYGIPGGLRPGDPGYAPPLILRPDDPAYEEFNDKYGAPGSRGLRPGEMGYGTPLVLRPPDPAYDDYKGKYGSPKARASRPGDAGTPLVIRPGDPAYDQFMNKYGPPSRRGLRPGDPGYGAPVILRPEDPGYDDYLNTYGIPGGLRPGDPGYAPPLILRPDDPAYEEFNDKYGAPGSRGLRPGEMGYGTPLVLRPPDPAYDDYKGKYGSPKARASRPGDAGTPLVIRPGDPAYDQFMIKNGPPDRRGLRPGDPGYGAPLILRPGDPGYDDYLNTYGTPGGLRPGDPGYAPPLILRPDDPGYEEFNDKYGAPGSSGLRPGDTGYGTPLVLRPPDHGYDDYKRKYGSPKARAARPGDLASPLVLRPGDPGYDQFMNKNGPPDRRGLRPGDPGYGAPLILRPGDPGYDDYLNTYGTPGELRPGDPGYAPPTLLRSGDPGYDEFNDKYGAPGSKGLRPGDGGYGTPLVLRPEDPGYDEFRRKYGSPATRAVKPGDLDTPVVLRPGDPEYDEFNDKYGPPGSRGLRPGDRGYGAPLVLRPGDPGYDEYLPKYGAPGKRPGDPGPPIALRSGDPAYDEFNDKYGAPGSKGLRPEDGGYGTPLVLRPEYPGYDEFRRKYESPATRAAKPGDLGTPIVLRPGDLGYDEFNDKYGPPGSRGLRPGDQGYGAPLVLRPGDPGYDDYLRKYGAPVTRPRDLGPPIVLRPRDPGYDEFVNKYGPPGSRGLRPGDRSYGAPLMLRPEDPGYDDYLRKYGAPGPRPDDLGPPIVLRPADPGYDEFVNKYGPPGSRGLRPGHSGYGTPLVLRPRDPGYDEYLRKYGAPGTRPGDEDTFGTPAYKEKYESGFRDGYGDGYGDATTQQKFLWPGDPGYRDKAAMAGVASSIQALRPWDPGYQSRSVIGGPTGLSRPGDTSFQRGMLPGATGLRPGDPRYGRQARDRSPGTNGLGPDELQMLYSKPAYQHGYKAGYKKGLDDGIVASKILITPDPSLKKKETYQEPVARGCNPACPRKPQQPPPPPNYSYIAPQQQEPPPVDYSYLEPQIILMPYTAPLQAQPAPPRQQEPPPSVDYSYLEPRIILPYEAPLQAQPAPPRQQEPPPFDYSYLESQIIPPYAAPLQAQPAPPRDRSRPKAPDRRSGVPPRAPREKKRGDKEELPRKPEQNVGEKDRTEDKERKSRIRPEDEPKKLKREKSDSRTRTKTREPSNESMVQSGWLCWRTKKGEKEPPQEKKERKNKGAGSSKPERDRSESTRQEVRRDRSRNKNRSKSREKSVEDKSRLRREQSKRDMRNRTVESGEKVESSQPGDELAREPVREQPREQRRERQKEPSREPPRERPREQRSTRYPEKEKKDPSRTREPRKQTEDVSQNESNTQESSDKSSLTNDGVLLYSSKTAPTESHLDLSEQLSRRTNNAPNTRRENTDPNMRRNKRDLEERTIVPPYNHYNDAPDIHEVMPTFEYDTTSNSPPYREEIRPQAGGYYFGPNSNPRQEETVIPETWFEPKIYLEVVEPKTELNEVKPLTKGPISKSDTHAMQIQQTVNRPTGNKRRVPRGGNQQSLGIGDSTSHLLEPVCDSKCTMIPSQGVSSMSDSSSSVTSQVLSVLPSVLVYSDFIEKPHDHCEDSCLMDMKSEELKQARDLPESILPACCLKEMDREILNMINPSDDYTQSITSKCDTLCDMISTVKPLQEVPVEVHPKSCDPSCHIASEMQSILQSGPESYTEIPSTATYDSIIKPESCNLLESVMTAVTPTCCDKIPKMKQKTSAILVAQSSKLKSEEVMNVNYTVLAKSREDVKMSSPKNGVDCCDDLMQGQSVPPCCARPISEEVLNVNYTVPEGDPESIHEKIKRLKGRCQVKCNYDISKTEQNTREPSQVTVKNASETAADGAVAVVVLKVRNDSKLSSKNYQLNTDISTNVPKNPVIFDRAVEVSEFKIGAIANDEDDTDQYYVPLTGSIKPSELQADQLMKALQAKLDKQLNNKENPLDDHRNSEKPDQVVPTKPDQVVPSEVDIDCNQSVPIIQRVPESLMAKYHVNETRSANLNWISVSTSDATPVVQLPPASRSSFLSNLEALVPVMDTIPEESKSPGTAVPNENIRPCCIRSMTSRIRNLQRLDASVLKIHSGIVSSQMQEVPDCCEKFSEVFNDFVEKTNQELLDTFHTTDYGKSNCCRNFLAGKNKTFESQFNREEIISSPAYVTHLTAINKSRNASWDSAMVPIDHLTPVKDSSFSEANVKTLQDTNDTTRYEDYNENALMEDVPSEQIHSSQYESNSKSYTLDEHGHIEEFEEDERRCCLGALEVKVDVPCGVYGTCPDPPTSLVDACTSDNAAEKETPSRETSALTPEEFIKDIIKKSKVIIDKFNLQPKGVSEYATKVSTKEPKCPDHKLFGKGGPCCDCKKPIPQASKTTQPTPKPSQVQPVMAERSTQPRSLLVTSASVQPSPRQSREEERQSSYLSTVVSEEQRVEDYGFNLSPQSSVNHSIDADDSYLAEDRPNNAPCTSSDDPKTSTVAQIEPGTPSKASVSIQLNINHQQILHQPTTTLRDSANDPKTSSALSVSLPPNFTSEDMIIKEDSTDPRTPSINSFKVESGAASHKKTPIKHSSNDPKALSTTSAWIQQSFHRPDTRHTSHDPKTPSTASACNQPSFSSHIQENANDPKTPSITSAGIQPSVHTPSTRHISNDLKTPSIASACNQPSFSSHIQDGANDPRTLSITSAEIQLSPVMSREKTPLKHASNDAWAQSQASASVQPSFNSPKMQHNSNEPRTPSITSAGVQLTPAISQEKPAITHSTNDPMTPSESSYDAQCSSKVQTSFVNEWSKPAQVLTKAPAQPISRDFYNKEPQLINLPCSPEMDSVISCPFSNAQLQRPTCSITATLQCVPKNCNSTASDSCRRSTVTICSTHPSDRCQRKKIYCIDSPMGAACPGQSYSNGEQEVVLRPAVGKCCFSNGEHLKKMSNGYCKPVQPIKSPRPLSKLKCRDQPQQSPSCLSGSKSKTVPQICHPKPEPSISKGCKGCCAPLTPICSRDKSVCVNQCCKCKSNCLGTFSRELSEDCAGMSNYPIPPSCSKAGCWKTRNSKYSRNPQR